MKRKGFTLIETITVAVIIVVTAAVVFGRVKSENDSNAFHKGIQSIESAANKARNEAITQGKTYELTYDSNTQSLKVAPSEDTSATATPNSRQTTSRTTTSSDTDQQTKTSALGQGWSLQTFREADGSDSSELLIKFYADGTADARSAEFKNGDVTVTLTVKQNGSITVKRGEIADDAPSEWQAGNIEQRNEQ